MKETPTLADAAIRESLRPHGFVPARLGDQIAKARKFVLDIDASRFLSDLSHASYILGQEKAIEHVEKTRQLARLPHALTWIEYDARAFKVRTVEAYPDKVNHVIPQDHLVGPGVTVKSSNPELEDIVPTAGWLMEQFGETTFVVTIVVGGVKGHAPIALPNVFAWTTDDSVPSIASSLPKDGPSDSRLATGIHGYNVPNVVVGVMPEAKRWNANQVTRALVEWMGELRFVWALLSAVNDIPVGVKHVRPSKGFVARGRYRRFVEHSVISILIPKQRDPQTFARQVVAASRRRAHMVRGHWRRDWRQENNRIWIREHQRGDSSLGFVLHDYKVEHAENDGEDDDKETSKRPLAATS